MRSVDRNLKDALGKMSEQKIRLETTDLPRNRNPELGVWVEATIRETKKRHLLDSESGSGEPLFFSTDGGHFLGGHFAVAAAIGSITANGVAHLRSFVHKFGHCRAEEEFRIVRVGDYKQCPRICLL